MRVYQWGDSSSSIIVSFTGLSLISTKNFELRVVKLTTKLINTSLTLVVMDII